MWLLALFIGLPVCLFLLEGNKLGRFLWIQEELENDNCTISISEQPLTTQ